MMRKLLVWPPVQTDEYGGTPSAAAYFSWFFGDIADEVILPIVNEPSQSRHMAFSLGSVSNLNKVVVMREIDKVLMDGVTHILMRSKSPAPLPGDAKCIKMTGSLKIDVAEGAKSDPLYYYIGSPETDGQDAYHCVLFTYWFEGGRNEKFLKESQERLKACKARLVPGQPVSVFGTGPSIAEVDPKNHSFDASVICNTIVKNRKFCDSLTIAAIVASDCHFHFSCNQYAFQFLSDLRYQMIHTDAIYVTFDKFAPFVMKKVAELQDRICGIPAGRDSFGFNFDEDFRVLPGESVVNMFMLPVACYLSNTIRLCGFTGRAPNDSYFWSHADAFQYQDLLATVRETHPGFFKDRDYDAYGETVGKQLSSRVAVARDGGIAIQSLTTSFYKGLGLVGSS